MLEEWRPVVNYEGWYEVSSLGRIRSLDRILPDGRKRRGQLIKPHLAGAGYPFVCLHGRDRKQRRYLHQIVAAAFIGPCPDGYEVNHLDGNKTNPVFTNLEYVTRSGNMRHCFRIGLKSHAGPVHPTAKITAEGYAWMMEMKDKMNQTQIARHLGVDPSVVNKIMRGRRWQTYRPVG